MARAPAPKKKEKPVTAERPKSIVLTEMQATYVEGVLNNDPEWKAAQDAGYARPTLAPNDINKSVAVQEALRAARDELSSAAQLSRADVIDGFMEAINMARLAADPTAMIRGWTEVGKMLGHYAPEVKKIEITDNQKRIQNKYEAMTDEELSLIIQGESTRVDE